MAFWKKNERRTQAASLKIARARGLPVATVLDVGVQRGTGSLIEVFPEAPHLLFEPVRDFDADIRRNYRNIRHTIVEAAVSDTDGEGLLQTRDGTSAWLSNKGEKVVTVRLDTEVTRRAAEPPYLLKIDVDGLEAPAKVIAGAEGIMGKVSCVVCEMTAPRFLDLAARIGGHGFAMWDIVENAYYDSVFYQCDAIFIREDLIVANAALKPFDFKSFDPKKWSAAG